VVPDVASLTLSPLAPTVVASDHITVTPSTASLTLSPQTPKALLGNLYSWQVSGTLPTTDAELTNLFTATNFSEILSDDNTYQDITGTGFLILQAKKRNSNDTDAITINIRSKSTLAPTTATIYMQLYDYNLDAWETVDTDNVTAVNTEMTLTVNKTSTATDYYNEDKYVTVRLYQEVA